MLTGGGSSTDSVVGGNDVLIGHGGNDTLRGAGVDHMFGGADNDVYFVNHASDQVIEYAGDGDDRVLHRAATRSRPTSSG